MSHAAATTQRRSTNAQEDAAHLGNKRRNVRDVSCSSKQRRRRSTSRSSFLTNDARGFKQKSRKNKVQCLQDSGATELVHNIVCLPFCLLCCCRSAGFCRSVRRQMASFSLAGCQTCTYAIENTSSYVTSRYHVTSSLNVTSRSLRHVKSRQV